MEEDNFIADFFAKADIFIAAERARQQRLKKWQENYFFEKEEDDDE